VCFFFFFFFFCKKNADSIVPVLISYWRSELVEAYVGFAATAPIAPLLSDRMLEYRVRTFLDAHTYSVTVSVLMEQMSVHIIMMHIKKRLP